MTEAPAEEQESGEEDLPKVDETEKAFADYMKQTRSRAQSGSAEERIEKLRQKLQGLQGQLVALASDGNPDPAKQAQIKNINDQISSIQKQISELTKLAAEEKAGREADAFTQGTT